MSTRPFLLPEPHRGLPQPACLFPLLQELRLPGCVGAKAEGALNAEEVLKGRGLGLGSQELLRA